MKVESNRKKCSVHHATHHIPKVNSPLELQLARNIPLELNTMAVFPCPSTAITPPDSAGRRVCTVALHASMSDRPAYSILADMSYATIWRMNSSPGKKLMHVEK